jgi:ATP-dependent exoDNAse (exonuclease V) beta subunit
MNTLEYLAKKNPHPRDELITFDEGPHIYTIFKTEADKNNNVNGTTKFTSVTTWNHSHFDHFDADKIIQNMMNSKNWTTNKYYGMTADEIKGAWDKNRDEAAAAGTKMHFDIECYYNNVEVENLSIEFQYFKNFVNDFPELNKRPYRTEMIVFHEELQLAGSIDMIFEREDGRLDIYDWKRCRDIKKTDGWGKCSHNPIIEHLPDTNYWHYCLQLNTYKAILEEKYGKKVVDLYLVCLHPDNNNNNYLLIKVVDLQEEVKELFEDRKKKLIG